MKVKILLLFSLVFIISVLAIFFIPKTKTIPKTFILNTPIPTQTLTSLSMTCPDGYILIPGSADYKTSDFCVMKYDTKCSNPDPKCVTSEGVYKNNEAGCECTGKYKVVSTADGAPITFIPEDDGTITSAKVYCQNIGAHLINNSEWMTIARNVEQVPANWCNQNGTNCEAAPGTPGKILANGHNDSAPNRALPEGPDNQPCFETTTDGSNVCGGISSQKRTLILSNGGVIWDFAGNVWQWIDAVVPRKDEPRSIIPNSGGNGWVWAEFTTVPYNNDFDPSNPNWTAKQGVGRIYHYNSVGDTDPTLYTYIRGGNWRHGYDSGAFTIHMQPIPGKSGIDDVGFRCVTSTKHP